MPAPSDKKTIGVTAANQDVLDTLMSSGHFSTEYEAAKFALAVAMRDGAERGTTEGTNTKWNVGSFDQDHSLRLIVASIYDDIDEPYRLIEHLINVGLRRLDTGLKISPDIYRELFPSNAG